MIYLTARESTLNTVSIPAFCQQSLWRVIISWLNNSSVNLSLCYFALNSWTCWNIFMKMNTSMLTLRLPISYWATETQTRLVHSCLY